VIDLIQIVPRVPPALCGVADYAYLLAGELQRSRGVRTYFIAAEIKPRCQGKIEALKVHSLAQQSAAELTNALRHRPANGERTVVLLHYVGYGYQKRGCPFWLLDALRQWRKSSPSGDRRLVVMFHELYASGPPWTSAFWTSPLQRWLTKQLARLADCCFTNTTVYGERLANLARTHRGKTKVLPVFSTIGEPRAEISVTSRPPSMIIFGSEGWKKLAYTKYRAVIGATCRMLRLEKVVDIGLPAGMKPKLDVQWEQTGPIAAHRVSEILSNARVGFFTYPVPMLAKSSVFAAYAAHSLLPVTSPDNLGLNRDGLSEGTHFLRVDANLCSSVTGNPSTIAAVAREGRRWYDSHSLAAHSDAMLLGIGSR